MSSQTKKSGQKFSKRLSRFSKIASREGKHHFESNIIKRISHVRDVRLHVVEWCLMIAVITLLAIVQSFWYTDSYSVSSFEAGGTYTEGTLGRIDSLNPLFASTSSEVTLSRLLFASLAENDYSGHVGLGLADSIISDTTGKIWTVHLRDGLKWSDGTPLTVEDVLFTIKLIKNPAVTNSYYSGLAGVTVEKNANNELVFTLASPYADFESALNFPILPEHALAGIDPKLLLDSDFSKNPITSGPFNFNASQTISSDGEVIVYLSANKNYYKGKPMLNSFAVHAFLNKESIISALNSGSVTATAELSPKDSKKISTDNTYERNSAINSGVFAFINTKSPVLSNKTLRNAIQKGINVALLREIGNASAPLNLPILDSQIDSSLLPSVPDYDPSSAKTTIEEAGITADSAPISIVTTNDGYFPELAEAFSEQLRDLGFNTQVSTYDLNQDFVVNVVNSRAYDIFITEVELGAKPDLFSYYHSSQTGASGLNFSNYNSSIANDLILAGRSTVDKSLQDAKYESFLKYWVADAPAIALYQSSMTYFYNKNARTFSEDIKLVSPTDRFSEVNYWATEKITLNRTP